MVHNAYQYTGCGARSTSEDCLQVNSVQIHHGNPAAKGRLTGFWTQITCLCSAGSRTSWVCLNIVYFFFFGLLWFSTSYLPFGGVIWWYPPFSDKSRTFSSIFLDPVGKHLNILGQYLNWLETNVLEPTCTTGPRGLFHTTGWSRNHRTQGLEIPEVVVFFAGMVPQAANCRGFWMVRDACEPFVYAECIWYRLCTHKHYIYIEVQNVDKYVNIHVLCISSDVLTDSESAIWAHEIQ